jgi:hypothetical protein
MPTRPAILIPDRLREIRSGNPQLDAQINAILRENQALLFQTLLSLQPSEAEYTAGLDWTPVLEGVTCEGTTFTKPGECTADAWDASVYSEEGHLACTVSFRANQTDKAVMVGLNSDPTTDHNFTSLDYAFYCQADGTLDVYVAGLPVVSDISGGYATTDQLSISYDGLGVRFYKNATLVHTAALSGARLYLDSSFFTSGAAVSSVTFGPIARALPSAVGWTADSVGKPLGVRQIYASGTPDRSNLLLINDSLVIVATAAAGNAGGLPAIPINDSLQYQVTIRYHSDVAATSCLTVGFFEIDHALPSGKTHVGIAASAESCVEDADTAVNLISAGSVGTTSVEETYTYTPTAGSLFATLGFWNNTPSVDTNVYIEWIAMTPVGSNVDLIPGVRSPMDTPDILGSAVTTPKIADDAVETDKIADAAVETAKIADEAATEVASSFVDGPITVGPATNAEVDATVASVSMTIDETTDVFEIVASGRSYITASGSTTGSMGGSYSLQYRLNAGSWVIIDSVVKVNVTGSTTAAFNDAAFAMAGSVTGLTAGAAIDIRLTGIAFEFPGDCATNHIFSGNALMVTRVKR